MGLGGRGGGGKSNDNLFKDWAILTEFMSDRHPVFYAVFSNA